MAWSRFDTGVNDLFLKLLPLKHKHDVQNSKRGFYPLCLIITIFRFTVKVLLYCQYSSDSKRQRHRQHEQANVFKMYDPTLLQSQDSIYMRLLRISILRKYGHV